MGRRRPEIRIGAGVSKRCGEEARRRGEAKPYPQRQIEPEYDEVGRVALRIESWRIRQPAPGACPARQRRTRALYRSGVALRDSPSLCHELREILWTTAGHEVIRTAVVIDGRTPQRAPEVGHETGEVCARPDLLQGPRRVGLARRPVRAGLRCRRLNASAQAMPAKGSVRRPFHSSPQSRTGSCRGSQRARNPHRRTTGEEVEARRLRRGG
jgi:hypothetical protein